ncbi:hypothetical protein OCK74_20990 [Chitinophagaceae bacterium LB-8]|uniref:Uncharacterized protein n=1 Tax=Paraflavisolibacter caeni TaxID=2982496 RepID=A0A9X2XPR6_9BACT|nr:hypothetical protein [Paraflavisolibacter caeni]MCU7551609.1 hypothetical protein [Paraflavisolibacter caeni]
MIQQTITQQHEIRAEVSLNLMVRAAWNFAYTALWAHNLFSSQEKERAQNAIRQYLLQCTDRERAYYCFCERVLLAREYVRQGNHRYIPLPSHWLDRNNPNGFAGTEAWLDQMLDRRSSLPLYRWEWKALAEAVLEMARDDSDKTFWYWKIYFLERGEGLLWELFLEIVANMQYGRA